MTTPKTQPRSRADRHNNPAAITTDMAKQAGLKLGVEYEKGDPFQVGAKTFYTARLLADPVLVTIAVIDKLGFYTKAGAQRWTYIAIPEFVWDWLTHAMRENVVGFMYQHEGGVEMRDRFPDFFPSAPVKAR